MRSIDADILKTKVNQIRKNDNIRFADSVAQAVLNAIDEAPTVTQWIDIYETKPASSQYVLYVDDMNPKEIQYGYWYEDRMWDLYGNKAKSITDWMPAPELPIKKGSRC